MSKNDFLKNYKFNVWLINDRKKAIKDYKKKIKKMEKEINRSVEILYEIEKGVKL